MAPMRLSSLANSACAAEMNRASASPPPSRLPCRRAVRQDKVQFARHVKTNHQDLKQTDLCSTLGAKLSLFYLDILSTECCDRYRCLTLRPHMVFSPRRSTFLPGFCIYSCVYHHGDEHVVTTPMRRIFRSAGLISPPSGGTSKATPGRHTRSKYPFKIAGIPDHHVGKQNTHASAHLNASI